jgi:hypothetical protein
MSIHSCCCPVCRILFYNTATYFSETLFFRSDFYLPSDGQMLWQYIIVMRKYRHTQMLSFGYRSPDNIHAQWVVVSKILLNYCIAPDIFF